MAQVLLVDDDDSVRLAVRMCLERLDHSVTEACDGNQALEHCRMSVPDLVVTDLVMPDKEGLETIREMKRDYPGLPIIAMSGGGKNDPHSYLALATRLGAASVLAKPFSVRELEEAIKVALA